MPVRPPSAKDSFAAHCAELLASLGPVRVKRMFGGHGFYVDDVFIALAANDQLYLKTDANTRPTFEAAACAPFVFEAEGRSVTMSYWTSPDDAMESPMLMRSWARLAMEAALRARNAKPAKPAPRKKKSVSPSTASAKPAAATKKRAARSKP